MPTWSPVRTEPVLLQPTATAARWLSTRLRPRFAAPGDGPEVGLAGLDEERLRDAHARIVAGGATPAAAAKWLAGWFPGGIAGAVGWTLAVASAALVVDPDALRWRLHADGWPEGLDLGEVRLVVSPDHPWAGEPGVDVVADEAQVLDAALAGLLAVAGPLVERLGPLAKVGRAALWAEVGDRLGLAVAHDTELTVSEAAADRLRAVVGLPAAPWRARPRLAVEPTAVGAAYLGQKGGCCLAYQCAHVPEPPAEPGTWLATYRERFPAPVDRADRCSTCSLLDGDDCRARQRLWVEHHRTTT